jgi:triphosphatase
MTSHHFLVLCSLHSRMFLIDCVAMMSEQELKLHVPQPARDGVYKAMRRGAVTSVRLRAQYFDTENGALAKAGVALRLRLEGRRWIQTLKMPGKHQLEKIELNEPRPGPSLDLSVYDGTPAQALMRKHGAKLAVVYQTDIRRLYRRIRVPGANVEVAFDQGRILSGELELPVCEVEFELVSGRASGIFDLGLKWLQKYGLILELRSKAQRGNQLATLAAKLRELDTAQDAASEVARRKAIASFWAPRGIGAVTLNKNMTCAQALSAITSECLEQIARNAAILAEIDTAGHCRAATPEHTHQLRVGIRRLRSAWSLFKTLATLPPEPWRNELKGYFSMLGATRDDDVLHATVMPELSAAGQPSLLFDEQPANQGADVDNAGTGFQFWLVQLLAWTIGAHPASPEPDRSGKAPILDKTLSKTLHRWHQKVLGDGLRFDKLPIETKHDLRKRAKRLRYGLQFAESLLPVKKLANYRRSLSRIQDILGEMNDLYVAREKFEVMRDDQPPAWFAVGWIASRLEVLTGQAQRAFKALQKADHFWG